MGEPALQEFERLVRVMDSDGIRALVENLARGSMQMQPATSHQLAGVPHPG